MDRDGPRIRSGFRRQAAAEAEAEVILDPERDCCRAIWTDNRYYNAGISFPNVAACIGSSPEAVRFGIGRAEGKNI